MPIPGIEDRVVRPAPVKDIIVEAFQWYRWAFGVEPTIREEQVLRDRLLNGVGLPNIREFDQVKSAVAVVAATTEKRPDALYDLWLQRLVTSGASSAQVQALASDQFREPILDEWRTRAVRGQETRPLFSYLEESVQPNVAEFIAQGIEEVTQPYQTDVGKLQVQTLKQQFKDERITPQNYLQGLLDLGMPGELAFETVRLDIAKQGPREAAPGAVERFEELRQGELPGRVAALRGQFTTGQIDTAELTQGLVDAGLPLEDALSIMREEDAARTEREVEPEAEVEPEPTLEEEFNRQLIQRGLLTETSSQEYLGFLEGILNQAEQAFSVGQARGEELGEAFKSASEVVEEALADVPPEGPEFRRQQAVEGAITFRPEGLPVPDPRAAEQARALRSRTFGGQADLFSERIERLREAGEPEAFLSLVQRQLPEAFARISQERRVAQRETTKGVFDLMRDIAPGLPASQLLQSARDVALPSGEEFRRLAEREIGRLRGEFGESERTRLRALRGPRQRGATSLFTRLAR